MIELKSAVENIREKLKEINPSMSYNGEEFELWQNKAREKLSNLIGMDKFERIAPDTKIEYDVTKNGVREIRFTFESEPGYRVPCHMMLPANAEKPPVIICLQGHSKGMHISLGRVKYDGDENSINSGDRDFCVRAVKEGFVAIAMEQRNFGECGGDEEGPKCFEASMTALLMGRTTIGERVWDVSRLIDVIENEFSGLVDKNCISCMGNSGGGTATAYVAALEDRIKLAMPSCAMCTYKDSIGAMYHCSCNYVPNISLYFEMSDLMAMAYPKYFVQVSGIEDVIFPVDEAEKVFLAGKKAYKDNGCGDKCTLVKGNGGHRFYADDAWPIVHKYLDY